MKASKRIFILIIVALISLIGLQMVWLAFVYKYKSQELKDKTRDAGLATVSRLQKEEDSKLILNGIDSLLVNDSLMSRSTKSQIKIIVGNIKDKVRIHHLGLENEEINEVRVNGDTTVSTTVVRIGDRITKKIIVHSELKDTSDVKKKAHDLQSLFLKMAVGANKTANQIKNRIDFGNVKTILKEELLRRGINIIPEIGVSSSPKIGRSNATDSHMIFFTPGLPELFQKMIAIQLFPDDVFGNITSLNIAFKSTNNFLLKQMAGLLAISLIFSILIGYIIIYIFRRMLSQEKLHSLKNDFINNMTHELKTPIATISLAVDALSNPLVKSDEEKLINYTRILKEENKKLNDHVEHVLQLALLEKGELMFHKKQVDINKLIRSSVDSLQLQIQKQKANIDLHLTGEDLLASVDEFHFLNVLNNILDNALKYSSGQCQIVIETKKESGFIIILCKDNGIGIELSQQQKIFDKFYRVQGGNLHDVKGFGLGLSYVKSIIESHDGSIELKSEINKGSEFIIKLKRDAA